MLQRRCLVAAMFVGNPVPSSRCGTSCLMLAAKVGALELYSAAVVKDTRIFLSLCWADPLTLALVGAWLDNVFARRRIAWAAGYKAT